MEKHGKAWKSMEKHGKAWKGLSLSVIVALGIMSCKKDEPMHVSKNPQQPTPQAVEISLTEFYNTISDGDAITQAEDFIDYFFYDGTPPVDYDDTTVYLPTVLFNFEATINYGFRHDRLHFNSHSTYMYTVDVDIAFYDSTDINKIELDGESIYDKIHFVVDEIKRHVDFDRDVLHMVTDVRYLENQSTTTKARFEFRVNIGNAVEDPNEDASAIDNTDDWYAFGKQGRCNNTDFGKDAADRIREEIQLNIGDFYMASHNGHYFCSNSSYFWIGNITGATHVNDIIQSKTDAYIQNRVFKNSDINYCMGYVELEDYYDYAVEIINYYQQNLAPIAHQNGTFIYTNFHSHTYPTFLDYYPDTYHWHGGAFSYGKLVCTNGAGQFNF